MEGGVQYEYLMESIPLEQFEKLFNMASKRSKKIEHEMRKKK